MLMKVLSYARKVSTFNGKSYDSIILYTLSMKNTYESATSSLSGHPVSFHELKVSLSKFNHVFGGAPCTFDYLDSIIGKNIEVRFEMAQYNGVDKFTVDSISVLGGDDNA